jgi:hypothetical protein
MFSIQEKYIHENEGEQIQNDTPINKSNLEIEINLPTGSPKGYVGDNCPAWLSEPVFVCSVTVEGECNPDCGLVSFKYVSFSILFLWDLFFC